MKLFKHKFNVVIDVPKEKKPAMALDKDSKFKYTKGADVLKTFKKYGFIPPTEYREDYFFKLNREASKPND